MAHTKENWAKAKTLWELDKSLTYIVDQTGISRGQISKKANSEKWQKETLGNTLKPMVKQFEEEKETLELKKETITKHLANLNGIELKLFDKVVEEELGRKSLLFSAVNLSIIRKHQMLEKNTKTVMNKVDYFEDGKKIKSESEEMEMPLSPNDYKVIDEGLDKNAVTSEIAPRHNPTTAIQINNDKKTETKKRVTIARRSDRA